jgi:uncharacterized damage-inducible protein DinB
MNRLSPFKAIYAVTIWLMFATGLSAQDPLIVDFKQKWINATDYTLAFARAMPDTDYGFRPVPAEMTYAEQLKHMAGNMIWLSSSYLQGTKGHVDPSATANTKKDIIPMLEKSFAYALETISRLTTADLDEQVEFFAGTMSRRRILMLMSDHLTHHRGQLVVYLRLRGIEPPRYKGW